jgi:hypothetical protein
MLKHTITAAENSWDFVSTTSEEAYKSAQAKCAKFAGPDQQSACKEAPDCIPCEIDGFHKCYYIADLGNACVQKVLNQVVDRTSGILREISDWAAGAWNDIHNWGSAICGTYTTNTTCIDARACTWCEASNQCYIYASYNNPCGNFQKGVQKIKEFWNKLWKKAQNYKACSQEQVDAHQILNDAVRYSADNVRLACRTYNERELYVERFVNALELLSNNDTFESLGGMADVQVGLARQSLLDAADAINSSSVEKNMLQAYLDSNECLNDTGNAMQKHVPASVLVPLAFAVLAF